MAGETDLRKILRALQPVLNEGEYVFCTVEGLDQVDVSRVVYIFKEQEGYTVVLEKRLADFYKLKYSFVASWITLDVHSSLEAVGLTATFSAALAKSEVSCNVVAAAFHDHIFVNVNDVTKAMKILNQLSGV